MIRTIRERKRIKGEEGLVLCRKNEEGKKIRGRKLGHEVPVRVSGERSSYTSRMKAESYYGEGNSLSSL